MKNPSVFPTKLGELDGMKLRDYFAAAVIGNIYKQCIGKELGAEYMANCAYIIADAMIEASNQQSPTTYEHQRRVPK